MEQAPIENQKFSFSRYFVTGEITLGAWGFVKKGVGAACSFFVISALTVYQYGVYNLLLAAYAVASDFFHNLFSQVTTNDIVRFIGEGREDKAKRLFLEYAFFRIAMVIIPAVLAYFLAPLLSSFKFGPEAVTWIRLLSVLFLVEAIVALGLMILKLRLKFKISALQPTIHKSIQLLILIYFFYFANLGIREVLIAQILAPILSTFIFLVPIYKTYSIWRGVKAERSSILPTIVKTYGKWEIPQFFSSDLNGRIRPWLTKLFLSTEAVGIFSVANTFMTTLKDLLPIRTLSFLVPRKIHDKKYAEHLFAYGTKYYLLLSLIFIVGGAIGVPIIIKLFFVKFSASIPVFLLLLPVMAIFAFTKLMNVFLVAERRQRFIFFQSILQNGLGIVFMLIFLPTVGLFGLALAEVGANFVSAAIKYYYLTSIKFIRRFEFKKLFSLDEYDRMLVGSLWKRFLGSLFRR